MRIAGDAGARLGGAYPGARAGMTGGEIVVSGDAGEEAGAGHAPRAWSRSAAGPATAPGCGCWPGTVIALGGIGAEAGLGNKRGTLVSGAPRPDPLPGYAFAARYRPPALRVAAAPGHASSAWTVADALLPARGRAGRATAPSSAAARS